MYNKELVVEIYDVCDTKLETLLSTINSMINDLQ